jgi:hypothetical protein
MVVDGGCEACGVEAVARTIPPDAKKIGGGDKLRTLDGGTPYTPMLTIIVVAIFVIFIIACAKLNCLIERRREEEDDGEDTRSQ